MTTSTQIADRFGEEIERLVKEVNGRIDCLNIAQVLQRAATKAMKECLGGAERERAVFAMIDAAKYELFNAAPRGMEAQRWLASCKAAAEAVDIETCKIWGSYVNVFNPYGVERYLPEELRVGTEPQLFVRSDQTDGPVWEGDLPDEKRVALAERIKRKPLDDELPFPF